MKGVRLQGYLFSFASALCYGSTAVIIKGGILQLTTPLVGVTISFWVGTLILWAVGWRQVISPEPAPRRAIVAMFIAGLLSGVGTLLRFVALGLAPVTVVGPLTSLSPLITMLGARIFFQRWERITWQVILGSVLVVAGAILVSRG